MSQHPLERMLNALTAATGHPPRPHGSGWMACCPAHDDQNPSLSISPGQDDRVLVKCQAGCETGAVMNALGMSLADLFPEAMPAPPGIDHPSGNRKTASTKPVSTWPDSTGAEQALERRHGRASGRWEYHDAAGNVVGIVLRWNRPDGGKDIRPLARTAAGWIIGAMPEPRPLYRLPTVRAADAVFVVEGEKAADAALTIGLTVTTSSGGSNAAAKSDWQPLAGKDVVIVPDNDEPGHRYAATVAAILTRLEPPARVRIISLVDDWPELPDKGDIADWCEHYDATEPETLRERVESLAANAPLWEPERCPEASTKRTLRRAVLKSFSEIEPEPMRWLWPGRIPLGMLTVISGNPGGGKSFLVADVVARVTDGRAWPDGLSGGTPADVILINVEDRASVVQRPRLDAAQADVRRVHRIEAVELTTPDQVVEEKTFSIIHAADVLRSALEQLTKPRLIVLDPLAAFLAGVRSNDQGDIRAALSPLVALAEEFDIALVFVHHNRKGTGNHTSERLAGSLQIGATVRQGWEVVRDQDDEERRLFLPGKNSNAREQGGLAFRIVDSEIPLSDQGDFVGRVEWEPGTVNLSADQAAWSAADEDRSDPWPVEWLRDFLLSGAKAAAQVKVDALKVGITDKQLRNARTRLRVRSEKTGFDGGWMWSLSVAESPEGIPAASKTPKAP